MNIIQSRKWLRLKSGRHYALSSSSSCKAMKERGEERLGWLNGDRGGDTEA